MKIRSVLWLAVAFAAVQTWAPVRAADPSSYGKGVSLTAVTPLDTVLKQPAQFEGKTVRVEGVVTAVCTEMGCWMALGAKDATGVPTLLIKVEEGAVVLPVSAKGHKAAAQGVVQRAKADDHDVSEAIREKASATKASTPDAWLLKATGVVVY